MQMRPRRLYKGIHIEDKVYSVFLQTVSIFPFKLEYPPCPSFPRFVDIDGADLPRSPCDRVGTSLPVKLPVTDAARFSFDIPGAHSCFKSTGRSPQRSCALKDTDGLPRLVSICTLFS